MPLLAISKFSINTQPFTLTTIFPLHQFLKQCWMDLIDNSFLVLFDLGLGHTADIVDIVSLELLDLVFGKSGVEESGDKGGC
jgi:hypothetical protein